MAPQVPNTALSSAALGAGAAMTPQDSTPPPTDWDLGQLSQLIPQVQASAPAAAPAQPGVIEALTRAAAPGGQAADPLAQQAQALSQQIAAMLSPPRPTGFQQFLQGMHGAAIAGLAPAGTNPQAAVVADLQRQAEERQEGITNRVSLLNQIRQQQAAAALRAQEQQRIGIEQEQADTMKQWRQEQAKLGGVKVAELAGKANQVPVKDVEGNIVDFRPMTEAEMSPMAQATLALKRADTARSDAAAELAKHTQDLRDAQTAMEKAKNDPTSPAYKQAEEKARTAAANQRTAADRVLLAQKEYDAHFFGTGTPENPNAPQIPGTLTDQTTGLPIGTSVANAAKQLGGTADNRATAAKTLLRISPQILQDIDANRDKIGAFVGKGEDFLLNQGIKDTPLRGLQSELSSLPPLLATIHGGRSSLGMIEDFKKSVGRLGEDPENAKTAIQTQMAVAQAILDTQAELHPNAPGLKTTATPAATPGAPSAPARPGPPPPRQPQKPIVWGRDATGKPVAPPQQ